ILRKFKIILFGLLLAQFNLPLLSAQTLSMEEQLRERLRNRIETVLPGNSLIVESEVVYARQALPQFYERRGYRLAWFDPKGKPLPIAMEMLDAIRMSKSDGLQPGDYHPQTIEQLMKQSESAAKANLPVSYPLAVSLELLLTDAYLLLGSHFLAGKIDPQTIDSEWIANRRDMDMASVLQTAIDKKDIKGSLENLLPPQRGYTQLREQLANYRILKKGNPLPALSEGDKLQPGNNSDRLIAIRILLQTFGDLSRSNPDSLLWYDTQLLDAVKRFQLRHGLDADGVIGKGTIAAITTSLDQRIEQIEVNLERWRWLPQDLGETYILVNIANFTLNVMDRKERVLFSRVIVGRDYRRTPVFSDKMTYIVFNPYWHVPFNIATQDILPSIKKNPDYLTQKRLKIFQGTGISQKEIDPTTLNWSDYSINKFPFQIRQDPGPDNALGVVKFMFPNKFNVYIHDTPAKELFQKNDRAFSSGCIRLQNPLDLAEFLLKDTDGWSRQTINEVVKTAREQTVRLPNAMPVHLLYWTAWVDDTGMLNFRSDVYTRDKAVMIALKENPPIN
ncbi:murein L,D-transpeptidase, partial [Calditrichota bacterium]